MVRVNGPHELRGGIELQPPSAMANPAAEVVGGEFDAVAAERDLPTRGRLQRFAVLQAKLERQARLVGGAASARDDKTERQRRLRGLGDVEFAEESVIGEREAVLLRSHIEAGGDGHVDDLPEQVLGKSSQLGLSLGIGGGNNEV